MANQEHGAEFDIHQHLDELASKTPVPVLWLIGKTQSGKTSVIKFLTGAEDAQIGQGFAPCTRYSRQYDFPAADVPLLKFLDTRGLEEQEYDPTDDLALFNEQAHVVIITIRVMDHALLNLIPHLRRIRSSKPSRPIILLLTCLHEAYPLQQHPQPYPFDGNEAKMTGPLERSIARHRKELAGLFDYLVPADFTSEAEGFQDSEYGGQFFIDTLVQALPAGYRQTLIMLEKMTHTLQEHHDREAMPYIKAYSILAASTAAIPIPWVDMFLLPGIQTRMIHRLAKVYRQPMNAVRFLELASTLGLGMALRQAFRELTKLIPFVGSAMSAVLAGSSTFALGKAFCYYFASVHEGHIPSAEELKRYYQRKLSQAEQFWKKR